MHVLITRVLMSKDKENSVINDTTRQLTTAAGYALIIGSILAVVFMSHHPSIAADGLVERLQELKAEAAMAAWVHGLMILVIVAWLYGAWGLSARLGLNRALPPLALILFSLGCLAYMLAALVSGFVVTELGVYYAGGSPEQMQQAPGFLRAGWIANQALANAGLIGTSLAIAMWSLTMLGIGGRLRWLGLLGLLASLMPAVLLLTGHLSLHVTGMTLVVVAGGLWFVITGLVMIRGKLPRVSDS